MAIDYTTNKQSFTGAVDVIQFTFQIPYFETSDINVTREDTDGTITKLTYDATPVGGDQFKVDATNNNPADGGRITLGADSTIGSVYTIERIVPFTQQYNLQEGSTIDPTALNKALDRVVAQNQQQNDNLSKSIIFPTTDPDTTTYDVSATTSRANKALGFDASGSVTEIDLVSTGAVSGDTSAGISISDNIIRAKVDNSTTQFSDGNIAVKTVGTSNIADDAVTLAKMQNISSNRLIGRTGSEGDPAGNIGEIYIDPDISTTSPNNDSIPSAKAVKDYVDDKALTDHTYVAITQGTGAGGTPSDTTVVITGGISKTFSASNYSNNASDTIQAAIDAIPKNLNGYHIYFRFGLATPSPNHTIRIEQFISFNDFSSGTVVIESKNSDDYAVGTSSSKSNRLASTGTSIYDLIRFRSCSRVLVKGLGFYQTTGNTVNYGSVLLADSIPFIEIIYCYFQGIGITAAATPANGGDQRGVTFQNGTAGNIIYSYISNVRFGIFVVRSSHLYTRDNNAASGSGTVIPEYGQRVNASLLQPRGSVVGGSTADYQVVYNGLVVDSGGTILT